MMLFVCEANEDGDVRLGYHLAFKWGSGDGENVTLACNHKELSNNESAQYADIDEILAPKPPPLILCPECAKLTLAEIDNLYGQWQRGEW